MSLDQDSDLLERSPQGIDQIVSIFEPNGCAHQSVNNANTIALSFLNVCVRHRYRVSDQRLNRTEVLGEAPQIDIVHELLASS